MCVATASSARGPAVTWRAWLALDLGDPGTAAMLVDEAIESTRAAGDQAAHGLAWSVRSALDQRGGWTAAAVDALVAAEQAYVERGDEWGDAMAAALRSRAAVLRHDEHAAEREAVAAVDAFRSLGDHCTLVLMLERLSQTLQEAGRLEEAEAAALEARDVSQAHGLRGSGSRR